VRSGLTIGSLFSGIGGLELGLEWAGHGPTLWQVECDEFCRRVLERHWPGVERFEDVRAVGADLAPVDIICGGFPCQDISCAGKGAGISEGTRSGLWFEFARIIRLVRPRFVVVENVAALLSRGLGVVLGDLAACGYDATWDCIPAAAVGAPHRRDRVFIVAYTAELFSDGGSHHPGSGGSHESPGIEQFGKRFSAALSVGGGWIPEPDVDRVAHRVPARVDRLRALGNAVVPQCAQVIGEVINLLRSEG
jgi:DNA (cytosine-5)-methyltransferase 1